VPPLADPWVSNRREDVGLPLRQCATEAGDLGDRAVGEAGDHIHGDTPALGRVVGEVNRAQLRVAAPGEGDLPTGGAGGEAGVGLGILLVAQVVRTATEQAADPIQRVVLVPAVPEGVLLDAAADLVDDLSAELDDVERLQDGDRVGQLVAHLVGVAAERVERGLGDRGGERLVLA
jgi:hypothetical protein